MSLQDGRKPKAGDRVVVRHGHNDVQGIVVAIAYDKEGVISSAKVRYKNWLGIPLEDWWGYVYDFHYLDKTEKQ